MSPRPEETDRSTPPAASAVAQTGGAAPAGPRGIAAGGFSLCRPGPLLDRSLVAAPYRRRRGDPLYRPLRIYTGDPGGSQQEGNLAVVDVPYEPLAQGPVGAMIEIDTGDEAVGMRYPAVDLDAPRVLIERGLTPSPSDPRFHAQMVYAVASLTYASFQTALGRDPGWGFEARRDAEGEENGRLRIRPFAANLRNALYDEGAGEITFGYYAATEQATGRSFPGSWVFTALSHDIVVHEVTHALLDGMRAHFNVPTGPDVLAFHEGFADLVAIFQKFTYGELVEAALRRAGGSLRVSGLLSDVARQFGQTTTGKGALRSPIEDRDEPTVYDSSLPPHEMGTVLTSAVFEAFATVYERKVARYLRLATGRSEPDPRVELRPELIEILAAKASRLAGQFLSILIRAVDYCPPVDLNLGEFLRAVVTADRELVSHDPWSYREAWIDAFARRRIVPRGVSTLSEESLLWSAPPGLFEPVPGLSFRELAFDGDPARPASREELLAQARCLDAYVSRPGLHHLFGLQPIGERVDPATVESIRTSRRIGPDGQVQFDLVAEITQRRFVATGDGSLPMWSGSTVVIDPTGHVRYVIWSRGDESRAVGYAQGAGAAYWTAGERWEPARGVMARLHDVGE